MRGCSLQVTPYQPPDPAPDEPFHREPSAIAHISLRADSDKMPSEPPQLPEVLSHDQVSSLPGKELSGLGDSQNARQSDSAGYSSQSASSSQYSLLEDIRPDKKEPCTSQDMGSGDPSAVDSIVRQRPSMSTIKVSSLPSSVDEELLRQTFESPHNGGGPIRSIQYEPQSSYCLITYQEEQGRAYHCPTW